MDVSLLSEQAINYGLKVGAIQKESKGKAKSAPLNKAKK